MKRINVATITLAEMIDEWEKAVAANNLERRVELNKKFPSFGTLDFKQVLIRTMGDRLATEIEAELQKSLSLHLEPSDG